MEKKRILAVDDEPNILMSLQFILDEEGFLVETAGDGGEALLKAESFKPDLVLLDAAMPVKDGFEVCRIIKEGNNPPVVVLLTAKGQPLERKKGLDVGADAYITKPFRTEELLENIRSLIG